MLESYLDIRKRIPEPPKWFDAHGVPRYGDFHPSLSVNVYASEVLLYEIACQSCLRRFLVEENWSHLSINDIMAKRKTPPLSERVVRAEIHYGDPPCFGDEGCCAGATMNCLDVKTVQFWSRVNDQREWSRVTALEGLPLEDFKVFEEADDAAH